MSDQHAETSPAILILGPTAGGKTALSIALAQQLSLSGGGGGECISCDSMQVYRGMDIGTAKPTAAERAAAPHHLLDVADPADESFTVNTWLTLANQAIAGIRERGRWPIIVGGTNLYVQSFLHGLLQGPPPDEALRAELAQFSNEELRQRMLAVDPAAGERIHLNDRKRTIRVIEVHAQTGAPLSEQQTHWSAGSIRPNTFLLGLECPVEVINRRINARVKAMIEAGLFAEVEQLHGSGRLGRQAREALGYKQVIAHLEGRLSRDEAVERIKIETRRYAKQQRNWLRRFRPIQPSAWVEAAEKSPQMVVDESFTLIQPWLDEQRRASPLRSA